ncbi:MAG: cytochrome c biogenesis CcdA family protein [Solirubrobacteraceae bacterium]
MSALFAGSAGAAFAAGLVAFFAPCCAAVMAPAYLAAIGRGSRWRVARMTALYVAGVAMVVWPITLGAAGLASVITRYHPVLFVVGGLMMIAVAVALWRGTMLPMMLPQPRLGGSAGSVFLLGGFAGAATACCAPVLAGAVALSATTGSWAGGALLGGVYILGLVTPLLPLAFAWGRLRGRVRDPQLRLRLGSHVKAITLSRLTGTVVFSAFGVLFITLALSGNAENAPGFQRTMGRCMAQLAHHLATLPNVVTWPLIALALLLFAYLVLKPRTKRAKQTDAQPDTPASGVAEPTPSPLTPASRPFHVACQSYPPPTNGMIDYGSS